MPLAATLVTEEFMMVLGEFEEFKTSSWTYFYGKPAGLCCRHCYLEF